MSDSDAGSYQRLLSPPSPLSLGMLTPTYHEEDEGSNSGTEWTTPPSSPTSPSLAATTLPLPGRGEPTDDSEAEAAQRQAEESRYEADLQEFLVPKRGDVQSPGVEQPALNLTLSEFLAQTGGDVQSPTDDSDTELPAIDLSELVRLFPGPSPSPDDIMWSRVMGACPASDPCHPNYRADSNPSLPPSPDNDQLHFGAGSESNPSPGVQAPDSDSNLVARPRLKRSNCFIPEEDNCVALKAQRTLEK